MRNLKKFLALVLAMIMAMSLMVTANAAGNYSDMADVTPQFVEAVDVLSGMKVFQGDEKGFRPGDTITRAEVATIVYRLATGDATGEREKLYSTYGNFADVKPDDWFAGAVGYCANAGYIKGKTPTTFAPYEKVTGYEALAMILRAVGYDKNGEFTGATWETNVASLATQHNLLVNINDTRYAGTLHNAARRDVVAELLFQTAAYVPMVTYTPAFGYQTGNMTNADVYKGTLGYKYYGLTHTTRIILGNQATGEWNTVLGNDRNTTKEQAGQTFKATMYTYPGAKVGVDANGDDVVFDARNGLWLNYKTGLDLFGHMVKVWYNAYNNNVYDLKDKATVSGVVGGVENPAGDMAKAADSPANSVSAALRAFKDANGNGFDVDNTRYRGYYISSSFSRIAGENDGGNIYDGGAAVEPFPGSGHTSATNAEVWVAISNNFNRTIDVLIPVNCEVAEISEVDNISAEKTIELKDSLFGYSVADTTESNRGEILQDDVMNKEAIVLGNTVVAVQVNRTTSYHADYLYVYYDPVYWLDTPTKTISGKVVAYDERTDAITLEGGTTLKRTIIADEALRSGLGDINPETMGPAEEGKIPNMAFAQYTITLDMQGNWLKAERAYNNNFIYGTYLDYGTQLGTGTFTYKMVGVGMDGAVTTVDVTQYWKEAMEASRGLSGMTPGAMNDVGMPYHNVNEANGMVARENGKDYMGFIINGKLADNRDVTLQTVSGIQSLAAETKTVYNGQNWTGVDFVSDDKTVIDRDSVQMTVQQVKDSTADGTTDKPYLYFTEQTKFIVVNGYGTDSLRPKVYNGISELLGDAVSVTLDNSNLDEILFTCSNYIYANTGAVAKQVDTIFIPSSELSRDYGTNTYFIHNPFTAIQDTSGETDPALLYTVYQGGERSTIWIDKAGQDVIGTAQDQFWTIKVTGETAADGRPIYSAASASVGDPYDNTDRIDNIGIDVSTGDNVYVGTTNNGLTAMITLKGAADWKAFNVGSVKVVNFVSGYTVNNLDDLNNLASLTSLNNGKRVKVCVEYAAAETPIASTIYVVAVEN